MATTTAAKVKPVGYTFTTVDVPGAFSTSLSAVNDQGELVGTYSILGEQANHGFTDIGGQITSFEASSFNTIEGVNSQGIVVGEAQGSGISSWLMVTPFIYANGTLIRFDSLSSVAGKATAINDSGLVVGSYGSSPGNPLPTHGFVYDYPSGTLTNLDVPGAFETTPTTINSQGVIAGWYSTTFGGTFNGSHGFIDINGTFTTIDFPRATNTKIVALNDQNQMVGTYGSFDQPHSFIDTNGKFTKIDVPGAASTIVVDINNQGVVAGNYVNRNSGAGFGFVYQNGKYTTIGVAGDTITDINNNGEIVGYYLDSNNVQHGFTATPPSQNFTFADVSSPAAAGASGSAGSMTVLPDTSGSAMSPLILPEQMIAPVV